MKALLRPLVAAAMCAALITPGLAAQGPTIGFKLGPSFSTLSISADEAPDFGTLTKFTGGGFVRFDMGAFALQPELMYVTKGGKFTGFEDGVTVEAELRFDYIEVPVLLVLPFAAGASIAPHIYAGPAFAFEVGCTIAASGAGVSINESCGDDDEDRRKLDVGAMLGGGVSIPMGPGAILLEARYNIGLLNLNTSADDDTTIRNRSGAVLVGYSIPIGQR